MAALPSPPRKASSRAEEPGSPSPPLVPIPRGPRCSQPLLANELKNELLAWPAVGREEEAGSSFEPLADTPLNKSMAWEREEMREQATNQKTDANPVPPNKDPIDGMTANTFFPPSYNRALLGGPTSPGALPRKPAGARATGQRRIGGSVGGRPRSQELCAHWGMRGSDGALPAAPLPTRLCRL